MLSAFLKKHLHLVGPCLELTPVSRCAAGGATATVFSGVDLRNNLKVAIKACKQPQAYDSLVFIAVPLLFAPLAGAEQFGAGRA